MTPILTDEGTETHLPAACDYWEAELGQEPCLPDSKAEIANHTRMIHQYYQPIKCNNKIHQKYY